ncbi:hypothetical protein HME9302_01284 [Alteripontixanthobacter maritimus]|uniref:BioF2-like acetyltransferase domain-containing protein n=1 Tax=Alteripontixanthobacter maritimus TaxID=2161824 RepID=A0A369Q949_9SPHN|nr:GNAT family N-acetyltransferase [Alteripontixanthobacter maritimus]RDC60085.1 hypothetical protein HME9302_01284 [Alteripontixanthobacter maritimus]
MTAMTASYHRQVKFVQGQPRGDGGPFDRAEWFELLAESGQEPLVVSAGDAAMALTRANGRIEPLRNWYSFIWRPLTNDVAALTAIVDGLKAQSHRVTLWPLPDEDGTASALEAAFRDTGWSVLREQCDHNHVLEVGGRSFDQYWETRPGRMRTTLKRKAKKVDVNLLTQFDNDAWADYEAVYADSWKPEEGDPAFLHAFAKAEGAAGRLRLATAFHDGAPVAAQFWTVENGTAYIHKLAHLDAHKALSAGTTLSAALFRHVIDEDRVNLIDFGTGNDRYKRDWMEIDRPRYRLDCLDPRQPAAWLPLLKRKLRSLPGLASHRAAG